LELSNLRNLVTGEALIVDVALSGDWVESRRALSNALASSIALGLAAFEIAVREDAPLAAGRKVRWKVRHIRRLRFWSWRIRYGRFGFVAQADGDFSAE
jgi:hypothetical protein